MVWATSPILAATGLALRVLWAAIPVAMLWVSKLIIDLVVDVVAGKAGNPSDIWPLIAIELALAVLSDLLMRGVGLCDSLLGDRFTNYVSLRLMAHAGTLDLASFEDPVFYDKLERARRQTTSRLGMLAQLASTTQILITLLMVSLAIVTFSWWFLILLVAVLLPVFWGETHFAVLAYSLLYRWTPERRELDYLRLLGASAATAKEVKIFGLERFLTSRSASLFERFYAENKSLAVRRAASGAVLNLLPTLGYYGAYAVVLWRTVEGSLSVGDLTFLVGAFLRSRSNMESLFSNLTNISEQALYIQDLFDFFDTQPSITSPPNALPAPRPIRDGFEFRKVSFIYPGSTNCALEALCFRLEKGSKTALIGENGAGKTTLVKLLARLYDPSAGVILLDGVDLRDYSVEELRKEIGVIFQDYVRYDMSARENIGVGRIDHVEDLQRIERAAQKSLANELVRKFEKGYDQMLGRRFEGGVDLSAGQWQKIALARAYMRDAQVLILDEPTASLDARAEYEVFLRFADLTRDRTAVLISHRFSTVRMADRILVLEGGRLVEQGSHGELLELRGRYAELFDLQAAGYR
jgi:ATP-binding cassette subfamily B protein